MIAGPVADWGEISSPVKEWHVSLFRGTVPAFELLLRRSRVRVEKRQRARWTPVYPSYHI